MFAMGAGLGLAARRLSEAGVWAAAAYGAWFALTVVYFCAVYPDWMFAYMVDADRLPLVAWFPMFALALIVSAASGALWTHTLADRPLWQRVSPLLVGLVCFAWVAATTGARYVQIGTTQEFVAQQTTPIFEASAFQRAANIAFVGQAGAYVGLLAYLIWRGRRQALRV